jgi:hypothetical protein
MRPLQLNPYWPGYRGFGCSAGADHRPDLILVLPTDSTNVLVIRAKREN